MRVLVADDHSLFRDGIASLLEAAGHEVVAQVGNGQLAVTEAERLRPDVILMDLSMPVMDGLEALRQIHAARPETQVVMLTVSDEDPTLLEAVRAGARGYLLKNLNADVFLQLLAGLEQGEAAMTRQTTTRLMEGLSGRVREPAEPSPGLTARELELLKLVASGLSNKAIAQTLSVSVNTVKYHMKNVLEKLGAQNRTDAVMHAIRIGLVTPDRPR